MWSRSAASSRENIVPDENRPLRPLDRREIGSTRASAHAAFLHLASRPALTFAGSLTIFPYMNMKHDMDSFVRAMKALSDPNRVRVLKMLQHKPMCVCEIKEALGIAQPTASKHLKILTDAGFISWEKDGLWVNYHLSDGRENPYVSTLLGSLRHWLEGDPDVCDLVARLPGIRREDICRKPVVLK